MNHLVKYRTSSSNSYQTVSSEMLYGFDVFDYCFCEKCGQAIDKLKREDCEDNNGFYLFTAECHGEIDMFVMDKRLFSCADVKPTKIYLFKSGDKIEAQ